MGSQTLADAPVVPQAVNKLQLIADAVTEEEGGKKKEKSAVSCCLCVRVRKRNRSDEH